MSEKVAFVGPPDIVGGLAELFKAVRDNNPGPAAARLSPAAIPAAAPAALLGQLLGPAIYGIAMTIYGEGLREMVKVGPNDEFNLYLPSNRNRQLSRLFNPDKQ